MTLNSWVVKIPRQARNDLKPHLLTLDTRLTTHDYFYTLVQRLLARRLVEVGKIAAIFFRCA